VASGAVLPKSLPSHAYGILQNLNNGIFSQYFLISTIIKSRYNVEHNYLFVMADILKICVDVTSVKKIFLIHIA